MTSASKTCYALALFLILLVDARLSNAQRVRGELRIEVHDPQGAAVAPTAELVSDANQFRRTFQLATDGAYVIQDLAFGLYRLTVTDVGFAPWATLVEVRSEVPVLLSIKLGIAPVAMQVQVSDAATLLDTSRGGTAYSIGRQTLGEGVATQSGRDLSDLVDDLPGWLYEANGILHPRGSEYDVQYVIDGLPITENRSPAFAPALNANTVNSMRVLTANYPAEYGRKLGGIVEVVTEKNAPAGWHGQLDASGGSFGTANGFVGLSYSHGGNRFSFSGDGFITDRYLDPPVLPNYTNHSSSGGFSASYSRDFSDRDRLRMSFSREAVHFLVPNELIQQRAGQRQDIVNNESGGQFYFQHIISAQLLLSFSGSVRDAVATLSSNPLSTPIIAAQERGYREGYIRGDLAGHHGRHEWKAGTDTILNPVHEKLRYAITDLTQFDSGTQTNFQFSDHRWDIEPSAYVQDQIHLGNWNVSAGLRFDHYGFIVRESAWSPRVGASRYFPSLNLLLHASYDRVFQTPAVENLLLASSPQLDSLNPVVLRLPVRPARANYYETGISKAFLGALRLDANVFRRDFRHYSDDDVLLDTGVSFPTAFARARIIGEEVRIEVPHWGRFSGHLSYANQVGRGYGPITGGLFLGGDAGNALTSVERFPVTQDQRNTARLRIHFEATRRLWLAVDGQYGSGLPAETGDADLNFLLAQYGPIILDRVNFARGRVRPNFALGLGGGLELYRKEQRSASVQVQAANLTNRVNVINFASLFSGTAVAPPRSALVRLKLTF
jgi:outer membrane cobalamin receptor